MTDLLARLLRHGYHAVAADRAARGVAESTGDSYVSRLTGRRAVILRGHDGVRLFYDETTIRRKGAIPFPLRGLLFGRGAVHGLDDTDHKVRKAVFLDLLASGRFEPLVRSAGERLARRAGAWGDRPVRLYDELVEVYGRTVLEWGGAAVAPSEARRISRELALIVDGFGGAPRAYSRGWVARARCDRWARRLVEETRDGTRTPPSGSALAVWAATDLPATVAAVELLNVLRPTVAVAWLGAFAGLYLDEAPEWRDRLRTDATTRDHVAFAHEVRRCAPFVPVLAGKVRRPTRHQGVELRKGDRVVLDVWGTDQWAPYWQDPAAFRPSRFLDGDPGPYDFVPQGGGLPTGHRCPGEPLTVSLLAETVRVLAHVDRTVPPAAHDVTLARMPTLPQDGLVLGPR
ncbi:cytochrome P450 [Nocardioides caldifontis]|uniref:cytochrome P450 n=1 Tax=Nocardioides caldifontis TaxID=2588938 RepID=UPI0011DFEFDB|nr:cytochrome P450 [Nocardioides caldifontis]